MCVLSMVHDHYLPKFPGLTVGTTTIQWPPQQPLSAEQVEAVKKLIAEFYEATRAAKVVDSLTGQPDCVDPAKATLVERVRALEIRVAELERQVK